MTKKAPERHLDKERNKILNAAVTKLDRIINEHNPDVDTPIKDGVWDHLDNVCASLEARIATERDALAAELRDARMSELSALGQACDAYEQQQALTAEVERLREALIRIEDLTSHNMGMSDREERIVNEQARAALEEGKDG